MYYYRLKPAESTIGANKTRNRKGRGRRSADDPTPTPHEVNKYTYDDGDGDEGEVAVNLTTPTGELATTPPIDYPDEMYLFENVQYYADVYMEREFIITGLGHFQDYNIKVSYINYLYSQEV